MIFHTLILATVIILAAACGDGGGAYGDGGGDDGGQGPDDPAYAEVKPIVDRECGKCHNGSTHPLRFPNGAAFKASRAKARIANGTMPPGGGLKPDDKAALLAYLGG